MKKSLALFLAVFLTVLSVPFAAHAAERQTPVIVETVYPTQDVVSADLVATQAPYAADPAGKADAAPEIQRALNDCAANGGGTVFLPVGRYLIRSPLYIPQFVTLRGDYQDPDEGTEYGTVLIADVASSEELTPGLITVGGSAGAVGLTIWYPDQNLTDVKPYPYTFYVVGNGDYMLHTVQNCTLINAYRGVGVSAECANGVKQCHEMFTLENVKGTCLYEGLCSYNSADVDTYKSFYLSNEYWAAAGNDFNAPARDALDAYTNAHGVGMTLGDLEWAQFADIRISDRHTAISFVPGFRYRFSGLFCDLFINDCENGILIQPDSIDGRGKTWGLSVCGGEIEARQAALENRSTCAVLLEDVDLSGTVTGKKIRSYKVDLSRFRPEMDRSFKRPASLLYPVEADRTGKTDASAAVQRVLDAAGATGGVVYLPAGVYRFDAPVTVPSGVELRGSSSVPVRDQSGNSSGTLILSFYGYSDDQGALITLESRAGLSGVRIDYPLNNPVDDSGRFRETSPAVFGSGEGVYVINSFITLASVGIKLDQAQNAFLKKIVGCCCRSMFDIENSRDVWIEGCLQNANALPRNGYAKLGLDELKGRIEEANLFDYVFIPITREKTDYITLKNAADVTVFNTFIYGGRSFLNAENSDALLINIGSDGSSHTAPTLRLSDGNTTVLNSQRSTSDGRRGYRFYESENKAALRSFGSMGVDLLYREGPVLKNIKYRELDQSERFWWFLQPLFAAEALFGKLVMQIKQK